MTMVADQEHGDGWSIYHGDCCDVAGGLPTDSLHYSIYSPPFESIYTFSDDPRDISNNTMPEIFWEHYRFLIRELYRATMPGRLTSIHCMDLPTSKTRDGFIGIRDFPGEIIKAHQDEGFIFHSRVCIWKSPVIAAQRTKALGLLHKQIVKDSAMSRMGLADYVITMRKPGDNPEPVAGGFTEYHGTDQVSGEGDGVGSYSVQVWQRYASPVWMDIDPGDVLSYRDARAEEDERHISPLQLTVIRRCVQLWSNPGDIVFSPFAGIGSELYVAVQEGRKAIGSELKSTYYPQSVANLRSLTGSQNTLFPAAE